MASKPQQEDSNPLQTAPKQPESAPKPRQTAGRYSVVLEEPLSQPRFDKGISPCGSRQADSFFANLAGHNMTTEDMWSPRKYTKWIMPPREDGTQDPGTHWPAVVTDPSELKGIHQHTSGNEIRKGRGVHEITDFTAFYLPPWSLQGVFRKTRPALVIQWHAFLPNNGHKVGAKDPLGYTPPDKRTYMGGPVIAKNNATSLSSIVYRTRTAKGYRKIFLEEFHKTPGACDGVYVFRIRKMIESESHVRREIADFIKAIASDWRHNKGLFNARPDDELEKALEAYSIIEPLAPELTDIRKFDPVLVPDDGSEPVYTPRPKSVSTGMDGKNARGAKTSKNSRPSNTGKNSRPANTGKRFNSRA
ncbi:hypothetical protein CJU89_0873 [Yarrowia sp. B02]|nr:hypothetical protein CJU89_0873 [Yarrowia sp. B02]